MPMRVPLLVGTFPASTQVPASVGTGSSTTDALHTPITSLRATLPPKQDVEPLPRDVTRLLSVAADAIGKNNLQAALDATEEAEQLAPDRVEPLEIRLVALLSRGGSGDVRTVLDAISARDPRNAVGIAFRGLIAAQAGRDAEALALFALFIGEGAIERRGVAIPLPTEPGELEELAAACALRLGYADAALSAIAEAKRARATDGKILRRIGLLESDALVMLGRRDEACVILRGLIPVESALAASEDADAKRAPATDATAASVRPLDEIAMLALLRLDLIEVERGRVAERLRDALSARQLAERSDFAFWRVTRLAEIAQLAPSASDASTLDGTTLGARETSASTSAVAATEQVGRRELLRLMLSDGTLTRAQRMEQLERVLVRFSGGFERDPMAMRFALWLLAREDLARAIDVATELVAEEPCAIDAVVAGLLLAPVDVDQILSILDQTRRGATADAMRSRVLARFGFADEAISVAEAARSRDPASLPLLAAAALAAAEASDVTILGEVDEVAGGRDSVLAPILARAWMLVGDEGRANDRGGSGGGSLASLLAANRSEDAVRLEATGRAALSSRLPFADECLALAAEIDPFGDALDPLAQRLTAVESAGEGTGQSASVLKRWADAAVATSPAVPTRRKLGLLLALNAGSVTRPTEIPPAPLGARFDALVLAPSSLRLTSTLAAQRARPQTIDAQAAVAQTLIATGDVAGAVAILERCSRSASVEGNSRAVGALLATAAEIAKREPTRARDMSRTAEALLPRLGRATSGDMLAAMRLAIVARSDEATLERLAERLARASRPLTVADTNGCLELLNGVRRVDDDPFPAALLADAIARDTRAEADARRRIARASIALGALSGGCWQRTESLLCDLASERIEVFVRASDMPSANVDGSTAVVGTGGAVDLGRQFVRAADAHALIGDELGSRRLLERAVFTEPVSAEAQNNLAYFVVDRGAVDEATIAMSLEALAKAPDNPSILDTVGVLRYRQGRLRDGADGMGAITLFRQALRIRPEDPSLETLDHLGDALWQEGDQQAAIRCWQQVGQVAQLRYPPQEIAKNLVEFQRREFGLALLEPAPLLRRLYGRIADRAARKLEEVARGEPPSVRPMTLEAPGGMESGTNR